MPIHSLKKKIAVFASGTGTNTEKIIQHFKNNHSIQVDLIVTNKKDAGVINIARQNNIPFIIIDKEKFFREDAYVNEFKKAEINFIVLAGFLWKIPTALINAYQNKIINIHPALLPNYGGKGMYGHFVHEAVINNHEKESGITIHYVDEKYDHGNIIFQSKCKITNDDTPETLAKKIHQLEHQYYTVIIEEVLSKQ